LFCPLCGRAYRQFTDVAMVQCLSCEKWIHASCDDIDKEEYQKYNSKDLPYFCPTCKPKKGSLQLLVSDVQGWKDTVQSIEIQVTEM